MDLTFPKRDKIFLERFGFCYDNEKNRAVAVFLRYLSKLSPEHQQRWKGKELSGKYKLHPDYHRISFGGGWKHINIPICEAFIEEIKLVNKMSKFMDREPLFKDETRPQDFALLIRPTLKEYNSFIILLDNLMSSNINKKFFNNEIEDGKQKGTITIFLKNGFKNIILQKIPSL